MMYRIRFTGEFKRQMKLCQRRGYDMELLRTAIRILSTEGRLPDRYLPHILHGNRKGQWECHIQPDWLLVWKQEKLELTLVMLNTGTHADLFGKTKR
ncbi:MAG: type II toxin-antitoxin system YafQ family toxin [Prevotella sp.]|nr:type II toxin-antitoxin system YafQ family toxin [Prevotella sp.]